MRYSPLLPTRRPIFGRRVRRVDDVLPVEPTAEERRLLDRIISHMRQRPTR